MRVEVLIVAGCAAMNLYMIWKIRRLDRAS